MAEEARALELTKLNSLLDKSGNASTQPPNGQQPPQPPPPGLSEATLAQHGHQQGAAAALAAPKRASATGESNAAGLKAPNKKGKPDVSLVDQASTNVSLSGLKGLKEEQNAVNFKRK